MISIIIPFYNTEKYFEECLSSIKAQTFSDFEVLLIDDGSTDSSREIAQSYANKDSRFILLNNKHIGYPACKNLGLDKAKGEYICFIDSDDFVEKFHLENLYNALITTKSDISNCKYDSNMKFSNEQPQKMLEVFSHTESILKKYFSNTYPWNKLFKKSLWEGLKFNENVEALSDTILNHLVFERAKRTVYTQYKSYHYRIHNENITYKVRNYSDTYWPFRLNVYITVCTYICKYQSLIPLAKNLMRSQFEFCQPHLTEKQLLEFKENKDLQKLIV